MGNCLVTKLKKSVNNDNLCTMDELLIVIPKNTNNFVVITNQVENGHYVTFNLRGNQNSVHFCSNNSYNDNLGQSVEAAGDLYIKNASNEDAYLVVEGKDRIKDLFNYGHQDNAYFAPLFSDGNFLKYLPLLRYLYYSKGNINSENLIGCSALKKLYIEYNRVATDFNDIKRLSGLTEFSVNGTNITGDVALLSTLKSVDKINITYCTGTSGTLESLLEGLAINRVSTNSLDCFIYSNKNDITFNNTATLNGKHYIVSFTPNDAKKIIVTVDNVEIASYNGSTWTYNS